MKCATGSSMQLEGTLVHFGAKGGNADDELLMLAHADCALS